MSLLRQLERKVKALEKEKLELEKGIMRYYRTTPPHSEVRTLNLKREEVRKARKEVYEHCEDMVSNHIGVV
jgi:hypothetical protein